MAEGLVVISHWIARRRNSAGGRRRAVEDAAAVVMCVWGKGCCG